MPEIEIVEAVTAAAREACLDVRAEVFCGEQGVGREIEFDGLDDACRHFLAREGGRPAGTARSRPLGGGVVKLERIAVRADWRRRGVGTRLVEQALAAARADGFLTATMNAQTYARPFYERLGFVQEGDGFIEAEIPHIRMSRPL